MLKSYCLHQVSTTTRHVLKFKPRYIKKTLPKEGGIEAHQKPQNRKKNHQKLKKNSIKTENLMQNCQYRYIFTSQLL